MQHARSTKYVQLQQWTSPPRLYRYTYPYRSNEIVKPEPHLPPFARASRAIECTSKLCAPKVEMATLRDTFRDYLFTNRNAVGRRASSAAVTCDFDAIASAQVGNPNRTHRKRVSYTISCAGKARNEIGCVGLLTRYTHVTGSRLLCPNMVRRRHRPGGSRTQLRDQHRQPASEQGY